MQAHGTMRMVTLWGTAPAACAMGSARQNASRWRILLVPEYREDHVSESEMAGVVAEVVELSEEDLPAIVDLFRDAFRDYPVMRYVLGEGGGEYEGRLKTLIHFFVSARALRNETMLGIRHGGTLVAAATTSNPDGPASPPRLATVREECWAALGADCRDRYERCGAVWSGLGVSAPHLHLNMIGVRRGVQGRGLGRMLLERVHEMGEALPGSAGVTLTTEDPANVAIYERMGYEVVGRAPIAAGIETWSFFRPARRSEIQGVLAFLREAERLKDVTRTAFTSQGRPESVAAHSWRLSLMCLLLADHFPGLDFARLVKICIVHDLGEAIGGDVPAIAQDPDDGKAERERRDLDTIARPLSGRLRREILSLWDEYEAAATPEAVVAKALDKLETILQHNQGANPEDFDYRFNLEYGKRYTTGNAVIEIIREILDTETEARARDAES